MPSDSHSDPRHITLADLEAAAKASGVSVEVAARRIYHEAVRIAHQRIMRAAGVRCGCADCRAAPWWESRMVNSGGEGQ